MNVENSAHTRTVTIACLRFQMTLWNMEENLRRIKPLIEEAEEKRGPDRGHPGMRLEWLCGAP